MLTRCCVAGVGEQVPARGGASGIDRSLVYVSTCVLPDAPRRTQATLVGVPLLSLGALFALYNFLYGGQRRAVPAAAAGGQKRAKRE